MLEIEFDITPVLPSIVDRSFRSFFNLIKAAKQGLYRFEQIRLPGYLPKDGYFPLIMPCIKVKDGSFEIPMNNEFRKQFGSVRIRFPERLILWMAIFKLSTRSGIQRS